MNTDDSGFNLPSWHNDSVSAQRRLEERSLEKMVTHRIGDMRLLWLSINDISSKRSDRAYIERNSIALLSNVENTAGIPSKVWLGNNSSYPEIRKSGLWNVHHVGMPYDSGFIDVFRNYVLIASKEGDPGCRSIAPNDWHVES